MTQPSPQELIARLARSYPSWLAKLDARESAAMIAQYARLLADIPLPVLERVIDEIVCTEKWPPSIAQIREVAAERTLGLPGEMQALGQIEGRMAWARLDEQNRPVQPPPLHPLVDAVLDLVGGFPALRFAEDPAVVRGQFGRLYREARARAIRDAQVAVVELDQAPERRLLAS